MAFFFACLFLGAFPLAPGRGISFVGFTWSASHRASSSDGTILPPVLYENTRGFVESLAKQINRSYEENIFDGCAVLMRRLEEVLLIMSYQKLNIDSHIRDSSGNYRMLEEIVNNAQSNSVLNLGRNSKKTIEKVREMGNYSAHQIHYQCRREWIAEKIEEYRALVTELLSKAGLH